jgi:hypothetical protein
MTVLFRYRYTYLGVPGLLQCIELTRLNQVLLVHLALENLVFRARAELNGFAGKDCELFWSIGAPRLRIADCGFEKHRVWSQKMGLVAANLVNLRTHSLVECSLYLVGGSQQTECGV